MSVCLSTSSNHSRGALELDSDRKYTILTCHTGEYAERFLVGPFIRVVAHIIARYVVDGQVMDRQGWLKVFGVDIGDEADRVMLDLGFDLDFDRFYAAYHGPNPVDVMEGRSLPRQVCESSLIPTIVPERVRVEGRVFEYNLNLLGELADYEGINGHRARYFRKNLALTQHGGDEVEETHLHIQLKDVVARNKCWEDQVKYLRRLNNFTGYGCAIEPCGLAQITAIVATYALTGQRYFGDKSGEEGQWTIGRTAEETVEYGRRCYMVSGGFRAGSLKGSAPAALSVTSNNLADGSIGVGVQRKYSGHKRKLDNLS